MAATHPIRMLARALFSAALAMAVCAAAAGAELRHGQAWAVRSSWWTSMADRSA
jgi:hypothetical protein